MVGAEDVETSFKTAEGDVFLKKRFSRANKTLDWCIEGVTCAHIILSVINMGMILCATVSSSRNSPDFVHYSSFTYGAALFAIAEMILFFTVNSGWDKRAKDLYQRSTFKLWVLSLVSFAFFAIITLFLTFRCTFTTSAVEANRFHRVAYSVTDTFTCPLSYREASGVQGGLLAFSGLAAITAVLFHAQAVLAEDGLKQD
mgnify:CR=1 FL=1